MNKTLEIDEQTRKEVKKIGDAITEAVCKSLEKDPIKQWEIESCIKNNIPFEFEIKEV